MRIEIFRRRFPEYGDMTDIELAQIAGQMLGELSGESAGEFAQLVRSPDVCGEIANTNDLITQTNAAIDQLKQAVNKLANKPEKTSKDYEPLLMAIGVQLQNISATLQKEESEPEKPDTPEYKVPKIISFKVKRDELGNITAVTPIYEAD